MSTPSNGTAMVQYQITNQSSRTHNLTMNAIAGAAQNPGGGYCENPFSLGYHQSCVRRPARIVAHRLQQAAAAPSR